MRENNSYIQASKYLFVLVKTMCNHIKSVPQIRQSVFHCDNVSENGGK